MHTIVRVRLHAQKGNSYSAEVLESFESLDDPRLESQIVAELHGYPTEFSNEAIEQAKSFSKRPINKRTDLTQSVTVTIDGEDAKDFDDAICVESRGKDGFNLKVCIADVSYYVEEGSVLDKEAYLRGTSIYFPGGVVPMLPEVLSNDKCSLVPKQDRAVLVCEIDFAADAEISNVQIYPAKIKSHARLTYTQVEEALFKNKKTALSPKVLPMLQEAKKLYVLLKKRRKDLGTLDMDLPEKKYDVNEDGSVKSISIFDRGDSHKMIEQFMLIANEMVSEEIDKHNYPSIYRIHELPDPEKMKDFLQILKNFDLDIPKAPKVIGPKYYQKLLEIFSDHPQRKILSFLLLRSLKQAVYSANNLEHFGLASPSYTHFTSPIRRYPDLAIHRILRRSGFLKDKKPPYLQGKLDELAAECSEKEQRAVAAERTMKSIKECRYMEQKIDEEFDALITSVKDFGFFVETQPDLIDGLVHVRSLGFDQWSLSASGLELQSRRNDRSFRLGDRIQVQLIEVDRLKRRITFRYIKHLNDHHKKDRQ